MLHINFTKYTTHKNTFYLNHETQCLIDNTSACVSKQWKLSQLLSDTILHKHRKRVPHQAITIEQAFRGQQCYLD